MPGRTFLSEDAEREERESRDRVREAEHRLRELRERRHRLLVQVRELSEAQRALAEQRAPYQSHLDRLNAEHRQLGRDLVGLRTQRESLRGQLAEAVARARSARAARGARERPRAEAIRREMGDLEHRQQTNALPLSEENALIDRLRQLRRQLSEAERVDEARAVEEEQQRSTEENSRRLKAELERVLTESARLRSERDRRLDAMKAHLLEVGKLVGAIRETAAVRSETMARVEELSREIGLLEREVVRRMSELRGRRTEARRTIVEHNRAVRDAVAAESAVDRAAEENLSELLKRGRVTLGG